MWETLFELCKVYASHQSDVAREILVTLGGWGDGTDLDQNRESSSDEPLYGQIGVLTNPLPPDADGHAEVWAVRHGEALRGIAGRDLRLSRARGNVKPGSSNLAGYRGAFVDIEPAPSGTGDLIMVYAPYQFDEGPGKGTPAKALSIQLDTSPGNESITIAHGEGSGVILGPDGDVLIKSANGENWIQVGDEGIAKSGLEQSTTSMVAGDPVTALDAVVAPPGGVAWFAQVQVALTAVATLLNAPGPVSGAPASVVPPVAPLPITSTMLKGSP